MTAGDQGGFSVFLDRQRPALAARLARLGDCRPADVQAALECDKPGLDEYLALLSPAAETRLEEMARRAQALTRRFFGPVITLYAPLYLSNECDNNCVYCGFSRRLPEKRLTLEDAAVAREAEFLHQRGFRHVLLVSGEKRDRVTISWLEGVISRLHHRFDSIGLEIFPLEEAEYRRLFRAGADSLTIYQEVYDRDTYRRVHPAGAKADYDYRLLTPERAAAAGFFRVNIGALLGLGRWPDEAAMLGLHLRWLRKKFPWTQLAVSFPRLKESVAGFQPPHPVSDRRLVQLICALRILMPTAGMALSTREPARLRDNLIPLGVTQMSAESRTCPGGYTSREPGEEQFTVGDQRPLEEVTAAIRRHGYEPALKDWDRGFIA